MKKDLTAIGISFGIAFIILKIIFLQETFANTFMMVLGIFYLYVLPGYALLLRNKRFNVAFKLALGYALGLGIISLIPYYLNILFKIPVFPLVYFYPIIVIGIGIFLYYKSPKKLIKK